MNTDNDDSDMINLDCIHMDVKIEELKRKLKKMNFQEE